MLYVVYVDPCSQKNYVDFANVDDAQQQAIFVEAQKHLEPHKDKTTFIRCAF